MHDTHFCLRRSDVKLYREWLDVVSVNSKMTKCEQESLVLKKICSQKCEYISSINIYRKVYISSTSLPS